MKKERINEEVSKLQRIAGVVKEISAVNNLGERAVSVPEEQWMNNFEDELKKQLMVKSPRAYQTVTRALDHMDVYDNYSDGGTQNNYALAVKEVVQDVFFALKKEGNLPVGMPKGAEKIDEVAKIPDNIKKFAAKKGVTAQVNAVAKWANKLGKSIVGGTAIGKGYDTLVLDLTRQGSEVYIEADSGRITVNDQPVQDFESFKNALDQGFNSPEDRDPLQDYD